MPELDDIQIHTVGLGKARKASSRKRAKKAIKIIKDYIRNHISDDFKISKRLNQEVWKDGAKNPPRKVKIQATSLEGTTYIGLVDEDLAGVKPEEEAPQEGETEESEEESGEETEEEKEEKPGDEIDLPEDVKEALREGTIDEGKDAVKTLDKDGLERSLNFEKENKNRKGMKKFIRSNLR